MALYRRWTCVGLGLCAWASVAPAVWADPATETVSVTGFRPSVQVLPDRTVYTLENEVQKASGSLSDVVHNLPLVEVDPQGNVTLRGNAVTILVDGKPSPLFANNPGDALQQIPASAVERIEVITNPPAEFHAEGTGGVINIVMKKDRDLPAQGIVRAAIGSEGRVNGSLSGNAALDGIKLNGIYSERRDGSRSENATVRSDGTSPVSSQTVTSHWRYAGRFATMTASTTAAHNDFEVSGLYYAWSGRMDSFERAISDADATDISRDGFERFHNAGAQASFNYGHSFAAEGEKLSLALSHYGWWNVADTDYVNTDTASGFANYWQSRLERSRGGNTNLKTSYVLPLPGQGEFGTGYELDINTSRADNVGLWRDATMADWSQDADFTNIFDFQRTTHSGYATYRQKFGRFGVKGGLRLEQDFLTTTLVTTGERHQSETLGIFPSLFLTYSLTDTQQFGVSYSRRIQRPGADLLNPARQSWDTFNVQSGNPLLKPQMVDSIETSYHDVGENTDIVATGYYRATYKAFAQIYRALSDSVVLETTDNLAHQMAAGFDVNLNTKLLADLSLRTSGSLAYTEFNPGALSLDAKQSRLGWSIRGGLDWKITPDDQLQFNAGYFGKQRYNTLAIAPHFYGSFAFKHRFERDLSGLFTVRNLFESSRDQTVDTPGVHQDTHARPTDRVLFLGLVYTFGGAQDQAMSVDEGAAPGGR